MVLVAHGICKISEIKHTFLMFVGGEDSAKKKIGENF